MELIETTPELFNFDLDKLQLIVNGVTISLVGTYDELWFPGKEICMVMDYKDTQKTLFNNVKLKHKTTLKELKKVQDAQSCTFFWPFSEELSYNDGKAVYISEYGFYHLAMKCQLPIGEKFRDWLAEEVVPTIRKTGQYKLHKQITDQGEQLAIKDQQITTQKKQLAAKDEYIMEQLEHIANQDEHITRLREKVAVMTIRNETNHVFQLYKHRSADEYIFIRTQARRLPKAIKVVNLENY